MSDRGGERGRRGGAHATLVERMRARGIRVTSPRRLVAETLETARGHLDAREVFRLARRRDPSVHRATVYRTLNALKRAGLVDELDLMRVVGEGHFYEVRPSRLHIHLVCVGCGRVEEPGGPSWTELTRRARRETGFEPETVRIEMAGRCRSCRSGRRGGGRRSPTLRGAGAGSAARRRRRGRR